MNRRQVVLGSGAAMLAGAMPPAGFALGGLAGQAGSLVAAGGPPRKLLATAFPESTLAKTLLPPGAWHPFPKASERAGWQALPKDLRDGLVERAEKANTGDWPSLLATTALEFKRNGNRSRYEAISFGRRRRVADLVAGECVAGDGRFLDEIANGVWLICEESFWGASAHLSLQREGNGLPDVAEPVVDLFAAETSAQLAWLVYLLGEKLDTVSPLLLPRIHLEVKRRVLDPNLARVDFWWMGLGPTKRLLNNWTPWIDSNWLATLLLLEQDPERRLAGVAKACRSLDLFLADYSADGACAEGPGYWSRSAGSYFDACWLMVEGNGGRDPGVLTHPFVKSMADYVLNAHIAGRFYVNYGDAHVTDAPEPVLLYRFGKATGDAPMQEFAAFYAAQAGLSSTGETLRAALAGSGLNSLPRELPELFQVEEIRKAPRKDVMTRDSWYPALGLMTARERADDAKGFFIALQAANVGRSHGHEDSGSFIVYHDAEPVFVDLGVGTYTKQTFSTDRFKILAMQSGYHNLPTIGGVRQGDTDHTRASEFQYATDDKAARITLNLATAYPAAAGAKRWMRTLALNRADGVVEMHEEFELERAVPVMLTFVTTRMASAASDGVVVLTAAGTGVRPVRLSFDPKQLAARFETMDLTEDAGLEHAWGRQVYRVLLESIGPVAKGSWALRVS